MKSQLIIPILITLLSLISFSAFAVPPAISYQGYLTDASGSPVDGNVDITFSLYDAETSGSHSWQETQISIAVSKGLFKVELGSISPFATGQFDIPMWLGIQVGADAEMSPRQPLSSVGYALKAEDAETLGGLNPVDLNQAAHVTDTANPHNVTAAQTGAASILGLNSHTSNSANPHNVTAVQTGAASATDFNFHSGNTAIHQPRYQNSEAVSAMAAKANNNPLHHDKYTDNAAVLAIKANDGSGSTLDADLIDGMQANEIIDAASDEVRIPVPDDGIINSSGSYYLTADKTTSGLGRSSITVNADYVTIDLMGFSLVGNAFQDYGINIQGKSHITVRNGKIHNFTKHGIYQPYNTGEHITITDVHIVSNGLPISSISYAGIYLAGQYHTIKECVVSNNGDDGIYLWSHSNTIKECVVSSNGGAGIYLKNGGYINIEGSVVSGNGGAGIHLIHGDNNIEGCLVSYNGNEGIKTGSRSEVRKNTVINNAGSGIWTENQSKVVDNYIQFNEGIGIRVWTNSVVSGNTSNANGLSGIYTAGKSLIENNFLYFNNSSNTVNEGGIVSTITPEDLGFGAEKNVIKNNQLFDNIRTGILLDGSNNIVENNVVQGGGAINGITFNSAGNYYAHNRVGGHSKLEYNLSGHSQINGGDNIQF